MPTTLTITRNSHLHIDNDNDGVADSGDVLRTVLHLLNVGAQNVTSIFVNDNFTGSTIVAGSVKITPIAFDDNYTGVSGNTPITYSVAQGVLANDVDPDGAGGNAGVTVSQVNGSAIGGVINITGGTVDMHADGSFTFTPTTGFNGTATFNYSVVDAQGLANVTTGVVNIQVNGGMIWYVDNAYAGGGNDGSYLKPFTQLTQLNGVTGDGTTNDDVDGAGDTIFVYHNGAAYTSNITLEAGQKLYGDGQSLLVNGHNIGGAERTGGADVASNAVINVANSTTGVTLSSDNEVKGLDLAGQGTASIGIADNGSAISTGGNQLTIANVGLSGQGTLLDVDSGGKAVISLTGLSSTTSTGANGGVVDLTGLTTGSSLSVSGTTSITGAHGQAGIDISGNSGITVTFTGNVTVNTSTNGNNALVIDTNTGTNAVTFSGTANTFTSGAGNAVEATGNTQTTTVNFNAGGLGIVTTSGDGLTLGGGTTNISGGSNTIGTATGQLIVATNAFVGASNLAFTSLTSTGVVVGNAIDINNLDGGSMTVGGVTIANTNAASDALHIAGGSSTNFTFNGNTDINGTGSGGDGVELNGANGTVSFANLTIDGVTGTGNGLSIQGATNTVTVTNGAIGTGANTGDAVNITGGSGDIVISAAISKNTAGDTIEVNAHTAGNLDFNGAINASATASGINLVNNTGGTIDFTNAAVNLNTGANTALNFTNTAGTGAAVSFTGANLNIDTTSGTGINATSTTANAGALTITGANNSVLATTGRAINVDGVVADLTFHDVAKSGGSTTGIFLRNTNGAAGTSGKFVITGTASTAGSGGTISNIDDAGTNGNGATANQTGTGLYMENVSNVTLSNMIFGSNTAGQTATANFGIHGERVTNFTLTDSEFRGTFGDTGATGPDEDVIRFGTQNATNNGLSGTAVFQGNNIQGGAKDNVAIFNGGAGSLNLSFADSANDQAVIGNNQAGGNTGITVITGGTAGGQGGGFNLTMSVTGVQFTGNRADSVFVQALEHTAQNISVQNNTFTNNQADKLGGFVNVNGGGAVGTNYLVTFNISNNTMAGAVTSPIVAVYKGDDGSISGIINGNTIGTNDASTDSSGSTQGNGIFAAIDRDSTLLGAGTLNFAVRISNNNIHDLFQASGGIALRSNNGGATGTARLEATVTGNTVNQLGAQALSALFLQFGGATQPDNGELGLDLKNNILVTTSNQLAVVDIDQISASSHLNVPGYPAASPTSGAAAANALTSFWTTTNTNTFTPNGAAFSTYGANLSGVTHNAFTNPVPLFAANHEIVAWEDDPSVVITSVYDGNEPGVVIAPAGGGSGGGGGGGDTGGGSGGTGGGGDPPAPGNTPTPPPQVVTDAGVVSQAQLDHIVDAAIQRWAEAGLSDQQLAAMRAVTVTVMDMMGLYVGASTAGQIRLDSDGAGYGWFIDSTPTEDSEFGGSGTRLVADPATVASTRIDLLTVVMHELGHQIGLDDSYAARDYQDLMYGYLNPGERRLPGAGEAGGAVPGSLTHAEYAIGPITDITVLPAGKGVDIQFDTLVDSFSNQVIPVFHNQATATGTNLTTSPVTSNIEDLIVDSLTLGDKIFLDANGNGLFDAGDTGIVGVTMKLYADANGNGVLDGAEATTVLATATSIAGGAYSFSGLAPGDYVVSIDASNFTGGGAMVGYVITSGGADPDNNVDNDSNGVAGPGGTVISAPIRLDQNSETTADGTGKLDINNTLDFGFLQPNQPPAFTGLDGTPTFTEAGAAVVLDSNATASDPNLTATNYAGATLTLARSGGANASDVFGTTGTLSFSAPGSGNVLVGATVVGTFTQSGGSLVITFNSNATQALLNSTLQQLTYANSNDNPSASAVIAYVFNDGNSGAQGSGGALSANGSVTVSITPTNDAPAAAFSNHNLGPATEQTAFDLKNSGLSVSDVDGNAGSETVTLAVGTGVLNVTAGTSGAGVSGSGTGTVTITGTIAQINALLNTDGTSTVSYTNGSDTPPASASLSLTIHDNGNTGGGDLSGSDSATISISAVNDLPSFSGLDGTPTFAEGGAPVVLDGNATVSDPDLTGSNYSGATLTLARSGGAVADDVFGTSGTLSFSAPGSGNVLVGATVVGTFTQSGGSLVITFNNNATQSLVDTTLQDLTYSNSSVNPPATALIAYAFSDGNAGAQGSGGALSANGSVTVTITAADSPAVANDDPGNSTNENATVNIVVLANDNDPDGPPPSVAKVNGTAISVGSPVILGSGARVSLNADGSLTYDPNGQFNTLTSTASGEVGAVNTSAPDSFTYTLAGAGGGTATVSVTVNGVVSVEDHLEGDNGNNTISGTPAGDFFDLSQGGNDTAFGLGANDAFYFGAAFTGADQVDGGAGINDQIGLFGDYTGANALIMGPSTITNVEAIVVLPGFSYEITMDDGNVGPGGLLKVQATQVGPLQHFTFDGSAETNGSFIVYGGQGLDHIIGGQGNDGFYFGPGAFGSGDSVDGGAGTNDQIALDGNYGGFGPAYELSGGNIVNVEVGVLLPGPSGSPNVFNLTTNDTLVAAGQTMTIFGLLVTTNIIFNGSNEHDGAFRFYGGSGNDSFTGSTGDDWIFGGGGGDQLVGGLGSDTFYYDQVSQSTSVGFDKIFGFDDSTDTIDLPFAVTGFAGPASGNLSNASFDGDLGTAFAGLTSHEAGIFTATGGDMAGRTFLVIDADGVQGYQAGSDYVIEMVAPTTPIDNPTIFV